LVVVVEHHGDVVRVHCVVEGLVRVDRHVRGPKGVGVIHDEDDDATDKASDILLELTGDYELSLAAIDTEDSRKERRVHRSRTRSVWVPTREWVETHAAVRAGDDSEVHIVGGDPGHPVEQTEGLEELVGEPVVDEEDGRGDQETPVTGDLPAVDGLALVVELMRVRFNARVGSVEGQTPRWDRL